MKRVTCTLYSTWCIMICLVIPILSLLLFIQSLYSLSKLQIFSFTCILCSCPMKRVTCTLYSTWCIMICLVIPILSLLLFIQSLYSLSKLLYLCKHVLLHFHDVYPVRKHNHKMLVLYINMFTTTCNAGYTPYEYVHANATIDL